MKYPTHNILAIDTETTGLNVWKGDRPFAASFCDSDGFTHFTRGTVDPFTRKVSFTPEQCSQIQSLLASPCTKICFNARFDLRMLKAQGFFVEGEIHDAYPMAHVVTGGSEITYGLKRLCEVYLDYPADDEKILAKNVKSARIQNKKKGWKLGEDWHSDYWMADPKLLEEYAVNDAERHMLLYLALVKQL